jgi:hypothetical protein
LLGLPKFNSFWFLLGIFHWPITKIKIKASFGWSQDIYIVISSFGLVLYNLYTRVGLRAKDMEWSEVLLQTCWGTYWGSIGNINENSVISLENIVHSIVSQAKSCYLYNNYFPLFSFITLNTFHSNTHYFQLSTCYIIALEIF